MIHPLQYRPRAVAPGFSGSGAPDARIAARRPSPRASARMATRPEVPRAKQLGPPPDDGAAPTPSPDGDDRYAPFQVWSVRLFVRRRVRNFNRLQDAMQYISTRGGGRFDIRLPTGEWFSERPTRRDMLRRELG